MAVAGYDKLNLDLIFSGLDRLPEQGEELYAKRFAVKIGGGYFASLAVAANLGVDAKWVGAVGEGAFSEFLRAEIASLPLRIEELASGAMPFNLTAAAVTPEDRTFLSYGGDPFRPTAGVLYATLKGYRHVLTADGFHDVYRKLKAEGAVLLYDRGYDPAMRLADYADRLSLCDWYFPNRKEAMRLTERSSVEEAAAVLSEFLDPVIVKGDREGVYCLSGGKGRWLRLRHRFEAVDATGAGDAFLGGFLYGLDQGYDLEKTLAAAMAAGGTAVEAVGCLGKMLTAEQMESLLKKEGY